MKKIGFAFLYLLVAAFVIKPSALASRKTDAIDPDAYPGIGLEELGQLKWVLKLANEPIGDFKDLQSLDQVGIPASRYTSAFSVHFLAAEQYHKLAAWKNAIRPAMDRVIQKMFQWPV